MPRPISPKSLRRARIALIALGVLLALPIAIYIAKFGWSISSDHTRWSEMGSAMAGVYSPVLSLLTLGILISQVQLQSRMNEHTFDQSYVQDARSDLHFYLDQLSREIERSFADQATYRDVLVLKLAYVDHVALDDGALKEIAQKLHDRNHRLLAMWVAFYSVLAGLKTNDYAPYMNNYVGAKQKAIALLSFETCVALDNLVQMLSHGKLASLRYEFSEAALKNAA